MILAFQKEWGTYEHRLLWCKHRLSWSFCKGCKIPCRWIAKNDHTLVYGGGKAGWMGVLANEVLLHNEKVIGVILTFLVDRELSQPGLTRLEIVKSMSEWKNKMIEWGDCYCAPCRFRELIYWGRIVQHQNPCILFNVGGYYNKLKEFFDEMVEKGFLLEEDKNALLFADSITIFHHFQSVRT